MLFKVIFSTIENKIISIFKVYYTQYIQKVKKIKRFILTFYKKIRKSDFYFLNIRDEALFQKRKFYKKYILIPTGHQKKGITRKGIQNIGYLFQGLKIKQTSPVQESFRRSFGFALEYKDTLHTKPHSRPYGTT